MLFFWPDYMKEALERTFYICKNCKPELNYFKRSVSCSCIH